VRGLNSTGFFARWQAIYTASNPGHVADHWRVGGVEWIKERHYYWGNHYSFQVEAHRLEHRDGGKGAWSLLVVIERWWGPNKDKDLRQTQWCKLLSGSADRVLAWTKRQDVSV
jgi:hypothetical protein